MHESLGPYDSGRESNSYWRWMFGIHIYLYEELHDLLNIFFILFSARLHDIRVIDLLRLRPNIDSIILFQYFLFYLFRNKSSTPTHRMANFLACKSSKILFFIFCHFCVMLLRFPWARFITFIPFYLRFIVPVRTARSIAHSYTFFYYTCVWHLHEGQGKPWKNRPIQAAFVFINFQLIRTPENLK